MVLAFAVGALVGTSTLPIGASALQAKVEPLPAETAQAHRPWNTFDTEQFSRLNPRKRAAAELAGRLGAFGRVELDAGTGTPRIVARLDGFLTPTSRAHPAQVALRYVRTHRLLFGLSSTETAELILTRFWQSREYTHLVFAQTVAGIPVIGHGIVANVTADGRLINIGGAPEPNLRLSVREPELGHVQAFRAAVASVEGSLGAAAAGRAGQARSPFDADDLAQPDLRVFVGSDGTARLAWRVYVPTTSGEGFDVVVDAATGETLLRRGLATHAVQARVFLNHPGAPVGGSQVTVNITPYVTAAVQQNELTGPFATIWNDVNDDLVSQPAEEILPSSGDDYLYTFQSFNPATGSCSPYPCSWNHTVANSWMTNARQAAVQAFYFVNKFHDHLAAAPIGFTVDKGAFEGQDRVWINTEIGAALNGGLPDVGHVNNAFMNTPPVGTPPLLSMFLSRPAFGDQYTTGDTADDASVVFHEYVHGLSSRLITDSDGVVALDGQQSRALGEGWSDWYAMDYLVKQGLTADTGASGEVTLAVYQDQGTNIWRFQGLDCPVGASAAPCPGTPNAGSGGFTYGDMSKVQGFAEPHGDGEIWAETLWDLRQSLVAAHGSTTGIRRARLLVTRGMELSPVRPTFLDIRNATLQADAVFNSGADSALIWGVFAKRGMGYYAATNDSSDTRPAENFSLPPTGTSTGTLTGIVRSEFGTRLFGADVWVGGHNSGFPNDLTATTNSNGRYTISSVPVGSYQRVIASAEGGYDLGIASGVAMSAGGITTRNMSLRRDWASTQGGAIIDSFTGPNFSADGCGPGEAIDGTQRTAWLTFSSANPDSPGAKSFTVRLPQTVDVSSFAIDPAVGCINPGISASLGKYRIRTSADGVSFVTAANGTFTQADTFRMNEVLPAAGTGTGVRYVRLIALSPQSTDPGLRGAIYMAVTELKVYGGLP